MARYTDASCKLCRRERQKLFLKGTKCYTEKCPLDKRAYPPGQHGQRKSRASDYGTQLREKQKLRRTYGVLERQFQAYFARAVRTQGLTGEVLLQLLERRLYNVVFRMGFAPSRPAARQLVRHGNIRVNGRKVNIPSPRLRPGDVVTVKAKSHQLPVVLGDDPGFHPNALLLVRGYDLEGCLLVLGHGILLTSTSSLVFALSLEQAACHTSPFRLTSN